jgi:DNA-binding transcriptional LysR family regulator
MKWKKLNRFSSIVRFKSICKVVRFRDLSKSTWSRDMADLEQNFDVKLVFRDYNGIKLTEKRNFLLQTINSFKEKLNNFKPNS